MPHLELPGVSLYYEDTGGEGAPLLLLPGLATDSGCWAGCVSRWASNFRLLMPDPRGAGRTRCESMTFSLHAMAGDYAALLRELNIPQAHVLGHSMGGMAAMEFALRYPALVKRLVLAGTGAGMDPFARAVVDTWARVREREDAEEFFLAVLPWMVTRRYYEDARRPENALRYFLNYPHQPTLEGFRAQKKALDGFERGNGNALAVLECPTLVLGGEEDLLFPPQKLGELASAIQPAQLRLLPGVAHSPLLEGASVFSLVVSEFLQEK